MSNQWLEDPVDLNDPAGLSDQWVLIFSNPPGPFPEEALEFSLAAAALELSLDLVFIHGGKAFLSGPSASAWCQFPDFDMGRIWLVAEQEEDWEPPVEGCPAKPLGVEELEALKRGRRVLTL